MKYYVFVEDTYYGERDTKQEAFEMLEDYITNYPTANKTFMFVIEGTLHEYRD